MTTTEQNSLDTNLKEPYNPVDPIVKFDPVNEPSNIIVGWAPAEGESPNNTTGRDALKSDAIRYPLIKLNNLVLDKKQIYSFDMSISGFAPTVSLVIYDSEKTIQASDIPGINNIITVVITAPVNGANKKMSVDFYITNCEFNNDKIYYTGEYKLLDLKKQKCTQIGKAPLTTYQFLGLIAKECGLGFAATDGCETINDARWRQVYSQTYKDYIIDQIKFGGLDEYSVFDAWIDQFGYLVMANLSNIFSAELDPLQLTIKLIAGETSDESNVGENTVHDVNRMITNDRNMSAINNLRFERYESIISNNDIERGGTLNTMYYLTDPGSNNTINISQIQIIEESVDGIEGSVEYEFDKSNFIGVEMSDTPIVLQQQIVSAWKRKRMNNQLYVEMPKPNPELQRGMLVNVMLYEYNIQNKRLILDNYSNALTTSADASEDPNVENQANADTDLLDESKGFVNPSLSGLYYIDSVGFKYYENSADITQYMYLVKRGIRSNLTNRYTSAKIQ